MAHLRLCTRTYVCTHTYTLSLSLAHKLSHTTTNTHPLPLSSLARRNQTWTISQRAMPPISSRRCSYIDISISMSISISISKRMPNTYTYTYTYTYTIPIYLYSQHPFAILTRARTHIRTHSLCSKTRRRRPRRQRTQHPRDRVPCGRLGRKPTPRIGYPSRVRALSVVIGRPCYISFSLSLLLSPSYGCAHRYRLSTRVHVCLRAQRTHYVQLAHRTCVCIGVQHAYTHARTHTHTQTYTHTHTYTGAAAALQGDVGGKGGSGGGRQRQTACCCLS